MIVGCPELAQGAMPDGVRYVSVGIVGILVSVYEFLQIENTQAV